MQSEVPQQIIESTQRIQPTQIQFRIQNQPGAPNQQFIAVSTAANVGNRTVGTTQPSGQPGGDGGSGQTLLAVSSQQVKQQSNHQRVLSVPMSPSGSNQMGGQPSGAGHPGQGQTAPGSTQPMFVQQVRPVHGSQFQNHQIQMISPNGQLIPPNANIAQGQPGQAVNQPQLVDQNGQMVHAVANANEMGFKQMIINQSGHIIGPPPQNLVNHGQMVNHQQMIQAPNGQQHIQNIPAPGHVGNMVSIPNGVNVQMAPNPAQNPGAVMNPEVVHPMIHQNPAGQMTPPPGVKLQPGQVIMNGGHFRQNQMQMAGPEVHGPMVRMPNRAPAFAHAGNAPIHTPPRSPITRGHPPQRVLQHKPMIVPLSCAEEEPNPQATPTLTYHGHDEGEVEISPDLCFIGCVFYFAEHLAKLNPKECDFKARLTKWKNNILNYGGLVDDSYNTVTCTHIVAGKNIVHIF